jgi:DNA-binding transcriptional LysR family regulator
MIRLRDVDLNLLVVFQLLYRERKTTLVAESLGITQPSVSHALARLRKLFDDPLFERTARGLRPTPYADRVAEPIMQALAVLQDSVNYRDTFEPAASDRRFTVSMTDIGEIYFLPRLIPLLAEIAPGVQLSTVRDTSLNLHDALESGHVDIAVGLLPNLGAGFFQRRLFSQNYVCMMRRGHPLAEGDFDLEAFCRAKHALVVYKETGHVRIENVLAKLSSRPAVQLRLPHFVAVPYILSTSDLVVTVTEKLAWRAAEHFDLVIRALPMELPSVPINLFWHTRFHNDAGNQWLRRLFIEQFAEFVP